MVVTYSDTNVEPHDHLTGDLFVFSENYINHSLIIGEIDGEHHRLSVQQNYWNEGNRGESIVHDTGTLTTENGESIIYAETSGGKTYYVNRNAETLLTRHRRNYEDVHYTHDRMYTLQNWPASDYTLLVVDSYKLVHE